MFHDSGTTGWPIGIRRLATTPEQAAGEDTGKIFKRKLNAPCWESLRRQV